MVNGWKIFYLNNIINIVYFEDNADGGSESRQEGYAAVAARGSSASEVRVMKVKHTIGILPSSARKLVHTVAILDAFFG